MSSTVIINFYDSVANIPLSLKTLSKLKEYIAEKFQLIPSDVEEFDFYYFNEANEKVFISNNLELLRSLLQLKNLKDETKRVVHIALREGSRLYKEMFNEENINDFTEDSPSQIEKIREEIMLKEKELKEILEKERIEREKKEALEAEERKNKEMIELALAKQEQKKQMALELLSNQSEMIRQKAKEESEMLEKRIIENKAKEEENKKEKKEEKKEEKKDEKKIIVDPLLEIQKITKNMNKFVTKVVDKVFEKNQVMQSKKKVLNEIKNKPIHEGVRCDGCQKRNISGVRYKCTVCDDFDFCEECEEKNFSSHLHPFVKIRVPNYKLNVKVELKDSDNKNSNIKEEEQTTGYLNRIVSNVNLFINSLKGTDYTKQAKELKGKYDLESFEVSYIAKILKETKGDEDLALCKLFQ